MVFTEEPTDFNKKFDIVGCLIQHGGKLLLLHRHPHKASGGMWGLPAGKREKNEELTDALVREVQEETGIILSDTTPLFASRYVRDGDFDFEWHMFSVELNQEPGVILSPSEHSEFRWVSPDEALQMNLMLDLDESLKRFFKL